MGIRLVSEAQDEVAFAAPDKPKCAKISTICIFGRSNAHLHVASLVAEGSRQPLHQPWLLHIWFGARFAGLQ